ncbi:MAG: hypothetical protein EOO24_40735 [Comamonadaceae bacterium]|nr:MAG: hypothetical protein EOO24_40735 [Comamonadaceae bacterium]
MIKTIPLLALAVLATGCASIINDSTHPMKLETRRTDGTVVTGAACQLTNDYGTIQGTSGGTVQVRRSSKDLDITCKDPANPDAVGRAISRANAGLAGNIIFGGAIGAIIDHSKGTAYTYPTWVQLTFGRTLVFDRWIEKEGTPLTGAEPVAVAK